MVNFILKDSKWILRILVTTQTFYKTSSSAEAENLEIKKKKQQKP